MQILEKVGPELFILVEEKIEKVVLPSYVEASRVTETSVRLPKEVSSEDFLSAPRFLDCLL